MDLLRGPFAGFRRLPLDQLQAVDLSEVPAIARNLCRDTNNRLRGNQPVDREPPVKASVIDDLSIGGDVSGCKHFGSQRIEDPIEQSAPKVGQAGLQLDPVFEYDPREHRNDRKLT